MFVGRRVGLWHRKSVAPLVTYFLTVTCVPAAPYSQHARSTTLSWGEKLSSDETGVVEPTFVSAHPHQHRGGRIQPGSVE